MTKKQKLLLKLVLALLVGFFLISISITQFFGYSVKFRDYNRHKFLFTKEYQSKIDTLFCVRDYRESDSYSSYICDSCNIGIWEIKSLDKLDLSTLEIVSNTTIEGVNSYPAYGLNYKLTILPAITVRWKLPFKNHLIVNLDEYTEIIERFEGKDYIGLYGNIHKMSFCNRNGKHLLFFDYRGKKEPTLIIFKRARNRLYIIMVNSERKFDSGIKEMFKLK